MKSLQAFSVVTLVALTACNGHDSGGGNVGQDWVHTPDVSPTTNRGFPDPAPLPSATPSLLPTGNAHYTGPAEMQKYVNLFVADAAIHGVDVSANLKNPALTIQIASLSAYGASVIGLCETGGGMRRVTFEPNFWNAASETQRELVVLHELGHCILYRGHLSTTLASGAYASIMYPVILSSATYLANQSHYLQELFGSSAEVSDPAAVSTTSICTLDDIPLQF